MMRPRKKDNTDNFDDAHDHGDGGDDHDDAEHDNFPPLAAWCLSTQPRCCALYNHENSDDGDDDGDRDDEDDATMLL